MSSSSSSSDSSQRSETNNIDARVAGGDSSMNASAVNSTVSVMLTDQGTVGKAFEFATHSQDQLIAAMEQSQQQSNELVQSALDNVNNEVDQIAKAYETSKAGEQKVLVGIGVILVSIVAVQALKGSKA